MQKIWPPACRPRPPCPRSRAARGCTGAPWQEGAGAASDEPGPPPGSPLPSPADGLPAHLAALPAPRLSPPRSGHRLVDAAVFQPVPFRSAIADGCTHLLVLCTRPVHLTKASRVNTALADAMEEGIKRAVLSPDYMRPAWQVNELWVGSERQEQPCCAWLCACRGLSQTATPPTSAHLHRRLLPPLLSSLLKQAEVDYLHKDGCSQDDMLLKVGGG